MERRPFRASHHTVSVAGLAGGGRRCGRASSQGQSTAHIEVVTGVNPMRTTGAHYADAHEQQVDWLACANYNSTSQTWTRGPDEIYVLRPKRRIGE
jgi:hypothetical protein